MTKYRIKEVDGKFFPQWKFPMLPIWVTCTDYYDVPISCSSLEKAKELVEEWTSPETVRYHEI